MYVRTLHQKPYGPFADRRIRFGAGLTLAVGVNEAGKSTALEALRDLLWGIPAHTEQTFRFGRPALRLAARLTLPGGRELEVVRRSTGLYHGRSGAQISCDWQGEDDSGAHWQTSYGLSHAALREGGQALFQGTGDLAELVFAARTGHGVRRLLKKISDSADALYKDHKGNKSVQVRTAYHDYQRARDGVTEASAMAHKVLASRAEVDDAEAELRQANRSRQAADDVLRARRARAKAAGHARELHDFLTRSAVVREAGPFLAEPELSTWAAADERATALANDLAVLTAEAARLRADRAAIVVEVALLADAPEIRQLHLACEARLNDGRQARELSDRADACRAEAAALVSSLTGPGDTRPVEAVLESLHVSADLGAQLDGLAAELDRTALLVEQRERAVVVETRQLPDAAATADLDPGAVAAVEEACAAIRADGSPVSRRNNAIEERRAAILRRDECLREAGLPGGPPPQGVLPTTENVNAAKRLWAARQDEHKEAQRKLVDARRRLSKLRTRLNVAATDDVPTADSLATLRRTRDDVVAQLVKAWLDGVPAGEASELPGGVARAIDAADTAADRLFRDAKAAGERARLAREAAEAETESAELTAKVEDLAEEVRLAAAAWTSLWYALGRVPAVDDALQLRQHIAAARTAHAEVAAADSVVHELREQQERQTRALATALAAAGRPRPAADLDSLLVAADQVRRDSNDQQVARALAAAAQRRVQDARHASDEARRDHDAMVTRWQTLARSAGLPPHVDQAGWTRRQQIVGAAAKAMREAEDVGARARALRARHDAFVASLRALADRHGAGPGDDVAAAMEELAARLATAVTAGAEAGRLDERIQLLARDAEGKAGELAAANVVLETCRAGAGVADLEELAVAAQRGRTLAELAADVNRLTDLVTVALPDVDVERDVPELAATDPDELDAAVDEAERKLLELSELLETARNRRAEVVEQHRILTGRPGAAQARAQAQERLAALEDCAERYVVAHIQRTILAAELAEYERQHATSLLAAAGKLLDDLTGGRYVGLRAAHQGNSRSLVVVTAAEELRAPSQLSEGTADQVYLALRLAGIAALQAERRTAGLPTLPVVLDDVLMTFDDERAAAALRVMAELARDWQLIVFSHHVHLADVAESLGLADSLTVSHLPPPETVRATRAPEAIRALATASGGDGAALPVAQPVRQVAAPDTPAASHIREWARRNGHQLADRGRIPVTIIQAYEQANSH